MLSATWRARSARSPTIMVCPSGPITPRTSRPAPRASSAREPASSGEQPQRGKPTLTSTRTSRSPARWAAYTVADESTATVTRAPAATRAPRRDASSTSLARRRSWPRPAATIPSTSRMVAQVNPGWPLLRWWRASSVHLWALTWGRRRSPGHTSAMRARLASKMAASTKGAGVCSSATLRGTGAMVMVPACPVRETRR